MQEADTALTSDRLRSSAAHSNFMSNQLKAITSEKEEKPKDIWQLFKEAQQNILYLNKQRLPMEELERVSNERNSLLDRLVQLEDWISYNPHLYRNVTSGLCRIFGIIHNRVIALSAETGKYCRGYLAQDYEKFKPSFTHILMVNCMETRSGLEKQLDVLHIHNWQTSIVGPLFWDVYANQKNNPSQWNRRITDSMTKDFSWDAECSDIHVSAYESLKRL